MPPLITPTTIPLDLSTARARLAEGGPAFWRGLEELVEEPAFREMLQREFPDRVTELADPLSRRRFLGLLGASLALAGLAGCSPQQAPPELIVPYVKQPEDLVPGKPLFFATAMALGRSAIGLLVEQHEGRPTKVEGNPSHPASLGASDAFAQAAILSLYDPDRSQSVTHRGLPTGWTTAVTALRRAFGEQRGKRGAGLRILTGAVASPTFADQLRRLLDDFPEARWVEYEPVDPDENAVAGTRLVFGEEINVYYDLSKADVILALDADLLSCGGAHLRYARDFARRRRVWPAEAPDRAVMNRLYAVEGTPSTVGATADHRLRLRSGQIDEFTRALAVELRGQLPPVNQAVLEGLTAAGDLPDLARRWLAPLAADLRAHPGRCLIVAGAGQPPAVHAVALALNAALGNLGQTVLTTAPLRAPFAEAAERRVRRGAAGLRELTEEMAAGAVEVLLVLGANAAFTAPADVPFADRLLELSRAQGQGQPKALTLHLGLYQDETAHRCQWHVPEAHFLESWSDVRAFNGLVSIVQPLIAPLYGGRSPHDLVEVFREGTPRTSYEIVRAFWYEQRGKGGDFESFWRRGLHEGVLEGTQRSPRPVRLRDGWARALPAPAEGTASSENLEIVFRPDPTIHDGRFANNGWLQELPKPLTKVTWDGVALVSPATAERLGLRSEVAYRGGQHGEALVDLVQVNYHGRTETFPAWALPGHADDAVTVFLGYGRTHAGRVGTTDGRQNGYKLRTSDAPWVGHGAQLERVGSLHPVACTQAHHSMEGRALVRVGTLLQYHQKPHFVLGDGHHEAEKLLPEVPEEERPKVGRMPLTLYPEWPYPRYRWGMAIDLTACVGCHACVIACQAENNIPVVGKEEVLRGREMHWLRIDRYYDAAGGLDEPKATYHEPVPCMHCENAPCELVCPVVATAHTHDGLNSMIYNRCVGTRYCSNNCPYKVRRFNFLPYADYATESLKLGRNPDVTVRSKGVMEKCTYCVQRIRRADIEAEKRLVQATERLRATGGDPDEEATAARLRQENRIQDGEVLTACQQACPSQAIVFGDMNDPKSAVSRMKATPLNYGLLTDLNTRPRTTYLAAVRNPNPHMPG